MTLPRARRLRIIASAALLAFAIATTGGLLTRLDRWYYALAKPAWQPPDWLFGPAWTLIFALITVAGVKAWIAAPLPSDRRRIAIAIAVNALFNIGWSALFFTAHRPDLALVEVVPFWLSIVVLVLVVRRHSTAAVWLLVPYLGWVAFAGWLNYTIVRLNPPFH